MFIKYGIVLIRYSFLKDDRSSKTLLFQTMPNQKNQPLNTNNKNDKMSKMKSCSFSSFMQDPYQLVTWNTKSSNKSPTHMSRQPNNSKWKIVQTKQVVHENTSTPVPAYDFHSKLKNACNCFSHRPGNPPASGHHSPMSPYALILYSPIIHLYNTWAMGPQAGGLQ